jgi:hypothetical protein
MPNRAFHLRTCTLRAEPLHATAKAATPSELFADAVRHGQVGKPNIGGIEIGVASILAHDGLWYTDRDAVA